MTSTSSEAKASKAARPGMPFSNGVKPMHAVILLAVFLIKNVLTAAAASGGGQVTSKRWYFFLPSLTR